jgi:branched-chain amino acid transport system permease protein
MSDALVGVLTNIGLVSFLALSAYLLLLAGEVSFGQQAFFGIGAYSAGIATAMHGWGLASAVLIAAAAGAAAAVLVACATIRLRGMYFAMATLAAAELMRIGFAELTIQQVKHGELVGPNGVEGFRGIRWIFEAGLEPLQFLLIVYALLATVVGLLLLLERSPIGVQIRMIGEDEQLASVQGIAVVKTKLLVVAASGALAAIGGALYAHHNTYIEPSNFSVMLGVHAVSYALIGGLATAFGPLLGALLDVGLIEGTRVFAQYRMIVFGGLVAFLLLWRPRGILDERLVHAWCRRLRRARQGG